MAARGFRIIQKVVVETLRRGILGGSNGHRVIAVVRVGFHGGLAGHLWLILTALRSDTLHNSLAGRLLLGANFIVVQEALLAEA
jgi:hypothetical protein